MPFALGLLVGCSPFFGDTSGCGEKPKQLDAPVPEVSFLHTHPPCGVSLETVRGSGSPLRVSFPCQGESPTYLMAIRIDGQLHSLHEVRCDYGSYPFIELGAWEAADTLWHDLEVVLDPLDLFEETDETNNRITRRIRTTDPDLGLFGNLCGFTLADGTQQGTWVGQVQAGTPVNVQLGVDAHGAYPSVECSIRFGTEVDFLDTLSITDCSIGGIPSTGVRWTPAAAGVYDFELRVRALDQTVDTHASNNLLVKRLIVAP